MDFTGNGLGDTLHWSGLTLLSQSAQVETCNGTISLPAAMRNRAVLFDAQPGNTSATATLEATNATKAPLMLKSFFALFAKVGMLASL